MKKDQYDLGLFEHKIVGSLRSVAESPGMPSLENIPIEFPLHIAPTAAMWAEGMIRERQWDTADIVAVAPGSIQPHKRWPIERFVELCQRLRDSYDIKVVIIGTKNDHEPAGKIVTALETDVMNLVGMTSIHQAAALLKRCALLVGNDGGAMHLGAAVGCPSVSIVPGIEYSGSVEPWGYSELAVRHDVKCTPCYSFTFCPEGHNKCMTDITVHDAYARCAKVLGFQ